MSPTGQYLATIHVNNLGVYLWTNKTLFTHVSLKPIKDEDQGTLMSLPSSTGVEAVINLEEEDEIEDPDEEKSVEQIEDMVTLSLLPTSRWLHLLDIDIIKKRNKPKEALKTPDAAPFFLPTIPGMDVQFDFSSIKPSDDGVRTIRLDNLENYTAFGKLLLETLKTDDFSQAIEKLKSMGPSAIDLEVNSLGLEARGSRKLLLQYMKMINYMLSTNRDYELAQAYLSLFLKVHGKDIAAFPELHKYLDTLQETQDNAWQTLRDNLFYCLTVSDALKK
jgi:U3 small nucleolar RNA-associated protein 21